MNLSQEDRRGYTISEKMKKVWAIQLKLVRKVLEVCEKHNLKIWAEGGTLLGTVREHGYIPWDDDIDLVMLRDDYNKLLEIAPQEFKEPFFFQCAYTDKLYPRGHSQVRYNGTAAIEPDEIYCKFNQSIFIDIFVYDRLPKDKSFFVYKEIYKAELLRNLMTWRVYYRHKLDNLKNVIEYAFSRLYFLFHSFQKTFAKFEKTYSRTDCELSDELSCPTYLLSQVFNIRRKTQWYDGTIYMPFEDINMPVPIGYDKILKNQYGEDYMIPVKASSMHGHIIFDTEREYREVLKDIKVGKISLELHQ